VGINTTSRNIQVENNILFVEPPDKVRFKQMGTDIICNDYTLFFPRFIMFIIIIYYYSIKTGRAYDFYTLSGAKTSPGRGMIHSSHRLVYRIQCLFWRYIKYIGGYIIVTGGCEACIIVWLVSCYYCRRHERRIIQDEGHTWNFSWKGLFCAIH